MVDDLPEPTVFQVFVSDGKSLFPLTAIHHEGKLWLVPQWIESISEGWIKPLRLISMENLRVRDLRTMPAPPADFQIETPIPRAVFDGDVERPEAAGYTVIEKPDLRFRKPAIH